MTVAKSCHSGALDLSTLKKTLASCLHLRKHRSQHGTVILIASCTTDTISTRPGKATCAAKCVLPAQHRGLQEPGEGRAHLEGGAEGGRRAGGLQAGGRGAVRLVNGLRLGALDVAAVPDQDVGGGAGVQIVLVHPVGSLRAGMTRVSSLQADLDREGVWTCRCNRAV